MNSILKIFYLLSATLLTFCCRKHITLHGQITTIDIESNIKNQKALNLSLFTEDVKYIPMKTKNDMIFVGIWDCIFSQRYFLAKDLNKCVLYDYDGNVISVVGKLGRGPGEYQCVLNAAFGQKNNIYIQSYYDLFEYDLQGNFLNKFDNIFLFGEDYIAGSWCFIKDTLLFGKIASSLGNEKNKALIFNFQGEIKESYKNYIIFKREKRFASNDEFYANIYPFKDEIFFKEPFNDTLFYLSTKHTLKPRYLIKFGKYTLPNSKRLEFMPTNDDDNYLFVKDIFQTSDYIFLRCYFGNYFPAKRLTPKKVWGNITSYYNTKDVLGIFNIKNKTLFFCQPTSTDNPLNTSGLYNDIDAGPRFFPQKMVNDSTMAMWVDANKLKEHVASSDFKNNVPKFPEKKKKLEELANSLTDLDNPVLVIVSFKRK